MTRDEVLDAVYDEVTAKDTCVEDAVVSLLEEIVRLRDILAALREPSEAVSKAAANKGFGIDIGGASDRAEAMYRTAATRVIRAAVAAAEKEASA